MPANEPRGKADKIMQLVERFDQMEARYGGMLEDLREGARRLVVQHTAKISELTALMADMERAMDRKDNLLAQIKAQAAHALTKIDLPNYILMAVFTKIIEICKENR